MLQQKQVVLWNLKDYHIYCAIISLGLFDFPVGVVTPELALWRLVARESGLEMRALVKRPTSASVIGRHSEASGVMEPAIAY